VAAARQQAAQQSQPSANAATAESPLPENSAAARPAAPEIDCATVCANGCIRPDNCPSAEARARVAALLTSTSLDDLVSIATNSLESRTRARFERDSGLNG
jgi:diaminopimelate epimerase